MSTENVVRVEARMNYTRSVSCNDPAAAAAQAVGELRREVGAFHGSVEVEWFADSRGRAGTRIFAVRDGQVCEQLASHEDDVLSQVRALLHDSDVRLRQRIADLLGRLEVGP
jgi:hypothetical protein